MICGRSVHNQRTERLWRDVYEGVTTTYYELFYHMEGCGILHPENEMHLYCLHFVFLPRINKHLQIWKDGWIRHKISTSENRTPMQLYIMGMLRNAHSGHTTSNEVYEQLNQVYNSLVHNT